MTAKSNLQGPSDPKKIPTGFKRITSGTIEKDDKIWCGNKYDGYWGAAGEGDVGKPVKDYRGVYRKVVESAKKIVDRLLNESPADTLLEGPQKRLRQGDIVSFRGKYCRVDVENAVGASPTRPWVGNLKDNTGWYVEPSNVELVLSADEYDTDEIRSADDVERALEERDNDDN